MDRRTEPTLSSGRSSLLGRTALVTGAGRGIGREIAIGLAKEGANLVLVARTQAELDEVANRVRETGREAVTVAADLSGPPALESTVHTVKRIAGPVTVLINNAGGPGPFGATWEVNSNDWERLLYLNLVAAFRLCHAFVPNMIQAKWGRIVNITSSASLAPLERAGAYSVAKAGLNLLTKQLALELQDHRNISVACFAPGPMDTATYAQLLAQRKTLVGPRNFTRFKKTRQEGLRLVTGPARVVIGIVCDPSSMLSGAYIDIEDEYARGHEV